jgi:5-methylthioadenosine/S-adenosylhomocysteine deaminase
VWCSGGNVKQLIHGGRVLSAGRLAGEPADVLIEDDTIVAVLPAGESVSDDARRIDATNRLLIPGLVNAHTHATAPLSKAVADRWSLELLLNAYPWTAGGRTLEYKYLSAFIGAVEMVRKGCTACYDLAAEIPAPSVEGIDAVARAYNDAGMRAVIAPMMADVTFYRAIPGLLDAIPPPLRERVAAISLNPFDVTLATCRELLAKWPWDRDRLRPALGPTIPHHCSDAFITGCRDLAKEHGIGVQMHVAESKAQAVVGVKRYGTTLVGHLHRLGLLASNFTAAHAIWLDDDDIGRLADAGASVAHNPGSNLKLGSGLAATRKLRDRGVTFGIGTDGCTSSDNLNMFEAMRMAAFGSRVQGPDPRQWLSAAEAFEAATIGGARALGMEGRIGQIASGHKADVVFLDLTSINYVPLNDPLLHVVFCEDGTGIDRVMVGGKVLVQDGRVIGVDMGRLASEAADAAARLAEVNANARAFVQALEPVVLDYCVGLARQPYPVQRWCGHAHP